MNLNHKYIKVQFDRAAFIDDMLDKYHDEFIETYGNGEYPAEDCFHDVVFECLAECADIFEEISGIQS